MNWDFKTLKEWDDKIIDLANKRGLEWFPITYEVCDYFLEKDQRQLNNNTNHNNSSR